MPADVHRLLEKEAQQINSTIIANRRAYANLIGHLASGELNTLFVSLFVIMVLHDGSIQSMVEQ